MWFTEERPVWLLPLTIFLCTLSICFTFWFTTKTILLQDLPEKMWISRCKEACAPRPLEYYRGRDGTCKCKD